jgi:hypothetical protein
MNAGRRDKPGICHPLEFKRKLKRKEKEIYQILIYKKTASVV